MSVQYFEGVGRRKESSARVRVMAGTGKFTVNQKSLEDYFTRTGDMEAILKPFGATGQARETFDVTVTVNGGGVTGQTDAVTLGLAASGRFAWKDTVAYIATQIVAGVVAIPHGWGHKGTGGWQVANRAGGANVNQLMSTDPDDVEALSGMAWLTGVPVRLEAVSRD